MPRRAAGRAPRARLGDIASVSFGAGLGVRAQAGPVATGLGAQMDVAGFRGGRFFCDRRAFDLEPLGWSVDLVLASGNLFGLRPVDGTPEPYDRIVNGRGKYQGQYNPAVGGVFVPFWLCGEILDLDYYGPERTERPSPLAPNRKEARPHLPSWTHLEAAAALGVGVRLGFNPGELLDFLLGFFGVDLYGDDVAGLPPDEKTPAQKRFEEACKRMEDEERESDRRRRERKLARSGFTPATGIVGRDPAAAPASWRPDFAAAGWTERPCAEAGRPFEYYRAERTVDGEPFRCIVGIAVADTAEAAGETMAAKLRGFDWDEMKTHCGTPETIGDVLVVQRRSGDTTPELKTHVFRRGNAVVVVEWTGTDERGRWCGWPKVGAARPIEDLARALDTQILAAVQPHAGSAEFEHHAESAEFESHAESAEFAEH